MATLAPEQQVKQLEQCIQDCRGVVKDLQSLSQSASGIELQSSLRESIHHVEMCIHECEFAMKATP